MRRWAQRIGLGLTVTLLGLAAAVALVLAWSLPDHRGERVVAGLEAPVRILRDAHAIPHIEAMSEADATFALGWVHAQDRLWQMEWRRRIGQGRLAELIGTGGLAADRFVRLLRLYELAEASLAALTPDARTLVDAYVAGINAFLATERRPLPPEFWLLWHRPEPWTAADAVVWVKLMALDLAGNWPAELLRARLARDLPADLYHDLFPAYPPTAPTTLQTVRAALQGFDLDRLAGVLPPERPPGYGSNAWVVDGRHTRTGAPLLANDPHLGHAMPVVWYLAGVRLPEREVIGATLPGLPVFVLGRTDRIAWGMTNTGSDVQDLVVEELVGDATRTPGGGLAPLEVQRTRIRCRFCPDETFTVRWSVNGPLLSDLVRSAGAVAGEGRALALRWTALDPTSAPLQAGFDLVRARDWPAFDAALASFADPQQNVFYADVDGRIGMVSAGRVPIRRDHDGTLPMPGWEAGSDWLGTIPHAELPRAVDPEAGWLANANNPPVDEGYPHFLGQRWDEPYRMERIATLLAKGPHDVASFRALQNDLRSGLAAHLLPAMLDARVEGAQARAWLTRLAAWDAAADPDRVEPTVFAAWYDALAETLYADELGPLFDAYRGQRAGFVARALRLRSSWCNDVRTAVVEGCPLILGAALERGLARLEAALGPESERWRWGAQHRAILPHEPFARLGPLRFLGERRFAVGGDGTAVAAHAHRRAAAPPLFPSDHGPTYRQIVDLGDLAASRFVVAGGQVGHPLSRNHADLAVLWQRGEDVAMAPPPRPTAMQRLLPASTVR